MYVSLANILFDIFNVFNDNKLAFILLAFIVLILIAIEIFYSLKIKFLLLKTENFKNYITCHQGLNAKKTQTDGVHRRLTDEPLLIPCCECMFKHVTIALS